MSIKDKVNSMRQVRQRGMFRIPGFDPVEVVDTLFRYIDELESNTSEVDTLRVQVGILEAKIQAGKDGKFGTADDKVVLSRAKKKAPAKKKGPAKKKAPAKKKS